SISAPSCLSNTTTATAKASSTTTAARRRCAPASPSSADPPPMHPAPAFFHSLRERQARSAGEQRLLSGRDWLLVCAFVQLLTATYPTYRYIVSATFGFISEKTEHLPALIAALLVLVVVFVLLWWWARYAPFRAALTALLAYLAV